MAPALLVVSLLALGVAAGALHFLIWVAVAVTAVTAALALLWLLALSAPPAGRR